MLSDARKAFFSEEKNQKTLRVLSRTLQAAPTPEIAKVFCFFSTEKKTFLSYPSINPRKYPLTIRPHSPTKAAKYMGSSHGST